MGQLVIIKYRHGLERHHNEVGLIIGVDSIINSDGPSGIFYEILVGEENIFLREAWLDDYEENKSR